MIFFKAAPREFSPKEIRNQDIGQKESIEKSKQHEIS